MKQSNVTYLWIIINMQPEILISPV